MASLKVLLLTVILMRCDAYPEMMACDRALEVPCKGPGLHRTLAMFANASRRCG